MLDFYFVADEQPARTPRGLKYAGGMEDREFELAQLAGLIESRADYYGRFRWSGAQVERKIAALTPGNSAAVPQLVAVLRQAGAAALGLVAFGD